MKKIFFILLILFGINYNARYLAYKPQTSTDIIKLMRKKRSAHILAEFAK